MENNLSIAQFLISVASSVIFPVVALYIRSIVNEGQRKTEERIAALELALERRFNAYNVVNTNHVTESDLRYKSHELRVSTLETNWKTVHERFDKIQNNISQAIRDAARQHKGDVA